MKPPIKLQTPSDDKTEFENFVKLTKQILTVSKDELDKRIAEHKKQAKPRKSSQAKTATK